MNQELKEKIASFDRQNKLSESIRLLMEEEQRNPDNLEVLFLLSEHLLDDGQNEEATRYGKEALAIAKKKKMSAAAALTEEGRVLAELWNDLMISSFAIGDYACALSCSQDILAAGFLTPAVARSAIISEFEENGVDAMTKQADALKKNARKSGKEEVEGIVLLEEARLILREIENNYIDEENGNLFEGPPAMYRKVHGYLEKAGAALEAVPERQRSEQWQSVRDTKTRYEEKLAPFAVYFEEPGKDSEGSTQETSQTEDHTDRPGTQSGVRSASEQGAGGQFPKGQNALENGSGSQRASENPAGQKEKTQPPIFGGFVTDREAGQGSSAAGTGANSGTGRTGSSVGNGRTGAGSGTGNGRTGAGSGTGNGSATGGNRNGGGTAPRKGTVTVKRRTQSTGNKKGLFVLLGIAAVVILLIVAVSSGRSRKSAARQSASTATNAAQSTTTPAPSSIPYGTGTVIESSESEAVAEASEETEAYSEEESDSWYDWSGAEAESETQAEEEQMADSHVDSTAIHRYKVVVADVDWTEAFTNSISAGGYLARINSEEEWNVIMNILDDGGFTKIHFYLGGIRDDEQVYHWVDESFAYFDEDLADPDSWYSAHWYPGEPSIVDAELEKSGTIIEEECMNLFHVGDTWYFNDANWDLVGMYPAYLTGKVGYIIEFED